MFEALDFLLLLPSQTTRRGSLRCVADQIATLSKSLTPCHEATRAAEVLIPDRVDVHACWHCGKDRPLSRAADFGRPLTRGIFPCSRRSASDWSILIKSARADTVKHIREGLSSNGNSRGKEVRPGSP